LAAVLGLLREGSVGDHGVSGTFVDYLAVLAEADHS
jgi:hypothetical protein